MKKIILFLLLIIFPLSVAATEEWEVEFESCIDGDTATFIYQEEKIKVRFLAIDTPETKHPTKGEEPFGKEASNYTCNRLTNASKITLEFDENSDQLDKYDRYLAWVFVDNSLLQKELIDNGYAKAAYLYGEYKYTKDLEEAQNIAIKNLKGMWNEENKTELEKNEKNEKLIKFALIAVIIIIIIISIFNKKVRKKVLKDVKKEVNKEIKKILK